MLERPPAPRPPDGPRAGVDGRRAARPAAARGHLDRADPRRARRAGRRRPRRRGRRARVDPARVRRRAAAPAAAAAGRAHPARGPALEGRRGRRAARHHASRRSTARSSGPARRSPRGDAGRRRDPTPLDDEQQALLARYVDAFERYDIDSLTVAPPRGRDAVRCRRTSSGSQTHRDIRSGASARASAAEARASSRRRPTARRRSAVQAGRPEAATSRGRCRSSRCQAGRISGITFFLRHPEVLPALRSPAHARSLTRESRARPRRAPRARASSQLGGWRAPAGCGTRAAVRQAPAGPARRPCRGPDRSLRARRLPRSGSIGRPDSLLQLRPLIEVNSSRPDR